MQEYTAAEFSLSGGNNLEVSAVELPKGEEWRMILEGVNPLKFGWNRFTGLKFPWSGVGTQCDFMKLFPGKAMLLIPFSKWAFEFFGKLTVQEWMWGRGTRRSSLPTLWYGFWLLSLCPVSIAVQHFPLTSQRDGRCVCLQHALKIWGIVTTTVKIDLDGVIWAVMESKCSNRMAQNCPSLEERKKMKKGHFSIAVFRCKEQHFNRHQNSCLKHFMAVSSSCRD